MAASQQTSNYIPYPVNSDDVDIAGDLELLAKAVVGNKGNSTINVISSSVKGLQIDAANTVNALEVNSTSTGNAVVISKSTSGNGLTINETGTGSALVINSSSSGTALRVTNTGTGDSFVVEDSANPDATPFRIDNNGNIFINNSVTLSGPINTSGSATFVGNTSSPDSLVRITQEGTGNALLVEDASNPDSTPFAIDSSGRVLIGRTTADGNSGLQLTSDSTSAQNSNITSIRYSTDTTPTILNMHKARGTLASPLIVNDGDNVGQIHFHGFDGTNFILSSLIEGEIDGTPGTNDMPGRIVFHTTADGTTTPLERMRINNAGNIGIGITPSTRLHVSGGLIRLDNATQTNSGIEIYDSATAHGGIGLSAWALGSGTTTDIAIKSEASKSIRFYTDGANERLNILSTGLVGIGLSTPLYSLHISSNGESDITVDSSTTSSSASYFIGRKSRGTASSPTAVLSDDNLLGIGAIGHNGTSYPSVYSGEIRVSATENHSLTAQGGQISFFTVANTTTIQRQRLRIDQNGDLYVNELTSATPLSTNVYTTAGTGSNIAGSDITFNAGQSTGSANGGTIHFKTSVAGAAGATTNVLTNRLSLGATSNLIPAGTTTFAPLQFTSGTNLTTPVNGAIEYDGDKFYTTPNAGTVATTSGRGYIPSVHAVIAQANSGAATTTTPVTPFTSANDTLPVDANKLYKFKGTYYATATWTSGAPVIQIGFTFSNAPVSIKYRYRSHVIAAGTAISLQGQSTVATATTVTGTIGATNSFIIDFEGYFTSNATLASTISPFFQMNTTGVSTVMNQFSSFEIIKLGPSATTTLAGNWA